MTVFIVIVISFIAFFGGFLAGNYGSVTVIPPYERKRRAEIAKLQKEFKNFLEYDGSEQE